MVSQKPRRKCAVPNCQMIAQCGDYCFRHYNQWIYRRKKDLAPGDSPDGWPCPICGEKLGNLAAHMSKHHGISLREYYRQHNVRCSIPDCDRLAEMRGMCRMHRRQVKEGRFWRRKH